MQGLAGQLPTLAGVGVEARASTWGILIPA